MPLVQVKDTTARSRPGLAAEIAATATRLSAEILRKDPKVTAVIAEEVPGERRFCGGVSLADKGLASFWLDIRITESTNTKDEKAAFIAETLSRNGGTAWTAARGKLRMCMTSTVLPADSVASRRSAGISRASLACRLLQLPKSADRAAANRGSLSGWRSPSGKRCAAVASDLAADPGRRLLYGEAARDTARSGRARSAAPSPRTRSHIFRRAAGTLE